MGVASRPTAVAQPVWAPLRKTPAEADQVKDVYKHFESKHDVQAQKFKRDVLQKMSDEEKNEITQKLNSLGLGIDFERCHVFYLPSFEPINLNYDLCYVRHGKTEGNTEPRIFQGFCDYWENQLNETGKQQAKEAAAKMEASMPNFTPDLILCSPLGRAVETGEAFFKNHPEIPCRTHRGAREQQFGSWDNIQLRYMSDEDICHLFYLDQNVLVKAPAPHRGGDGGEYDAENFVDLIIRQAEFLRSVCMEPEVVKANDSGRKAKVLMYGHSMAGAAISMLLGHGKRMDDQGGLGFDGKYIMPNATPTMLPAKKPE